MKQSIALLAASGLIAAAGAAHAQSAGMVDVDVSSVAPTVAKNINVDVGQVPATVQLPVGVAAGVCGVAANTLGQQAAGGSGSCQATSSSKALEQVVQQQLRKGGVQQ